MKMHNVPVVDDTFYMKFAQILITGPSSYFAKRIEDYQVSLSTQELREWFLMAMEGFDFPYVKQETVFVIHPPQDGEEEGEYIQLDLLSPKNKSLIVRFRLKVEKSGHDAITLTGHALSRLMDEAINSQLYELYS